MIVKCSENTDFVYIHVPSRTFDTKLDPVNREIILMVSRCTFGITLAVCNQMLVVNGCSSVKESCFIQNSIMSSRKLLVCC